MLMNNDCTIIDYKINNYSIVTMEINEKYNSLLLHVEDN